MKTYLFLVVVIVLLATLLGLSYRQTIELQQTLEFHNFGIKKMAATQAMHDLSRGIASYFLTGQMTGEYPNAFTAHFKEYGVSANATGCGVLEPQGIYWGEYNRAVRDALKRQHGRDLIEDFDTEYRSMHP